jgi:hypothetical protein
VSSYVLCLISIVSSTPSLSSFALLSLVLSLFAMPKVDPRNKVGMIVHAILKIVLGDHTMKNVYTRTKKKRKKAAATAALVAISDNASTALSMPSTAHTTKKGKTTGKKKAAKPVDLCATPMWTKTNDGTSHHIVAIAHGQKWVVGNVATINGDITDEPSSSHQWYQKGPSGKRLSLDNLDFADMLWGRRQPTRTRAEDNKVGKGGPTKNNNQPLMGVVQ